MAELVAGMAGMGFQATSVGEAVRIVNEMVSSFCCEQRTHVDSRYIQRLQDNYGLQRA